MPVCLHRVLKVKAVVAAFNQEKALVASSTTSPTNRLQNYLLHYRHNAAGPCVPAITIRLITAADGLLQSSHSKWSQGADADTTDSQDSETIGDRGKTGQLVLSMQVLSSIFNPHCTCVSISCVHLNIVLIKLLHASYNPVYNKRFLEPFDPSLTCYVETLRWEALMIDWVSDYSLCAPCPHKPGRCLVSTGWPVCHDIR